MPLDFENPRPLSPPPPQRERIKGEPLFDVTVTLIGRSSNAGSIMYAVTHALGRHLKDTKPSWSAQTRADVLDEFRRQAMAGSYDDLLRVVQEWVHVE